MTNAYSECRICHRKKFLLRINETTSTYTLICCWCETKIIIGLTAKTYTREVIPEFA